MRDTTRIDGPRSTTFRHVDLCRGRFQSKSCVVLRVWRSERGNLVQSKTNHNRPRLLLPILAAGVLVAAAILAVSGTARGAGERQTAATIDVTQTCSTRVEPKSTVQVQAVVANTGAAQIDIPSDGIVGDAGTPLVDSDDFVPAFAGGDTNGNGHLDPGENWAYNGSYQADGEDETNIVTVEAQTTVGGDPVN